MKHREQEPDFDPDDSVERLIASAKDSRFWAEERFFAQQADCPTAEEIAGLERGLPRDASLRRKLARHLVACPRCLERNFAAVGGAVIAIDFETGPPESVVAPSPVRIARRPRTLWLLAAAGSLLLTVSLMRSAIGTANPPRLRGVFATDANGFEMRSGGDATGSDAVERRVAVEIASDGWLSLGRMTEGGVEPVVVDGDAFATPVTAGEEVLLPLDHAVACPPGETWLVLWTTTEPSAESLAELQTDVAKGYPRPGAEGRRIVPRSR